MNVVAPVGASALLTALGTSLFAAGASTVGHRLGHRPLLLAGRRAILAVALLYVVRSPARIEAGQSLVVDIDGVAETLCHHPLTEQPGASIAAAAVLAVIAGAGVLVWRRREAAA